MQNILFIHFSCSKLISQSSAIRCGLLHAPGVVQVFPAAPGLFQPIDIGVPSPDKKLPVIYFVQLKEGQACIVADQLPPPGRYAVFMASRIISVGVIREL